MDFLSVRHQLRQMGLSPHLPAFLDAHPWVETLERPVIDDWKAIHSILTSFDETGVMTDGELIAQPVFRSILGPTVGELFFTYFNRADLSFEVSDIFEGVVNPDVVIKPEGFKFLVDCCTFLLFKNLALYRTKNEEVPNLFRQAIWNFFNWVKENQGLADVQHSIIHWYAVEDWQELYKCLNSEKPSKPCLKTFHSVTGLRLDRSLLQFTSELIVRRNQQPKQPFILELKTHLKNYWKKIQ